MGKMIHVILPMTKAYVERGMTPGCSTDATLVHVDVRETTMTASPSMDNSRYTHARILFANEANKTLLVTTNNRSYVCPFNNTPQYSIFNLTEIKLDRHFASDPFVIALGKKNAAILTEQEMIDKADRAGVPAALDCIGIYAKVCHDNGRSATIPPVPIRR
ncbi:MAG: hypothetical protein WBE68_06430 [Candidatus Nitrosopolaris sp.]|jgi:hypothetical protein